MQARDSVPPVAAGTTAVESISLQTDFPTNPAAYVRAGLALIPIPRGLKGPRFNGWQQEANAIRSEEGAAKLDGCNIGLAHRWCGTCAVDVDDYQQAQHFMEARGIDLQALLFADDAVQIKSGKPNCAKLLYRLPQDVAWLPTFKLEGVGLELRCASRDGAATVQDVLPPSIHPDTGKPYEWGGAGDWRSLPTLPDALLKLWRSLSTPVETPRVSAPVAQIHAIPEGGRNAHLTSLAGTMRRRGMEQAAIEAALLAENAHKCQPPLPDAEVRTIAASVARYAPAQYESSVWPEPQALDREAAQSEPYPLDALPGAIGAAVREYQAYGQQPVALVASSLLAVMSLAAQGLADVARDERLTGPLSLNFLIIAQSGERKTAADKALGAALGEWERERADAMRDDIKRNRAALDAWAAEQDGIKAAIKSAMRKKPDEADELRQRLMEHALQKPAELIAPRLRYEDVNPQSLAFMLAAGHPSAALWSDEGGMVTGSLGMGRDSLLGFISGLNRLWDGGAIHHDRKQAPSVHLEGRRLTVSLMVQPLVLRELTARGGGLMRGSGFLARYLVAAPLSTMGTRLYQEAPRGMLRLAAFHQRIHELLSVNLPLDDQGRLSPPLLRLTVGAFSLWRDYHDEIERELKPLGDFATVCDFAAKSAENAARIAGCLSVFEGAQGAIPRETMQCAVTLARWYLREALRVLDEPQGWADARLLDAWLAEAGDSPIRDVLRLGPSPLRDKGRRNAAIEVLADLGRVRIEREGRRETLARNPALRRIATATPATFATVTGEADGSVAGVATVAVADEQNPEIERGEL